jgi:hypothetical protein
MLWLKPPTSGMFISSYQNDILAPLHSDESDYFGLSNVANSLDLTNINANANLT